MGNPPQESSDTNLTCDNDGQAPSSPQSASTTEETTRRSSVNVPMVCCALLASMTTGGATYAFGLYGGTLKKNLHLTQSQLDTISTATFFAGLLSWLPGMFIDRFGTRLGISLGGLFGSCSLMLYWIVSKGIVVFPTTGGVVGVLSLLGVATFLSCALVTGSVFKIISCTCGSGTKGAAVGVAKGYVGLGAGVYTCLFHSIRQPGSSDLDFLPMAATLFILAASTPSLILLPSAKDDGKVEDVLTPLHFRVLYTALVVLAAIVVFTSLKELHQSHSKEHTSTPNYFLAAFILLLWTGSIGAQMFLPHNERVIEEEEEAEDDQEEHEVLLQPPSNFEALESPERIASTSSDDNDESSSSAAETNSQTTVAYSNTNKNLYQMLQTPEAWLMVWTTTILVGAGTVETNNLSQMVESLHYSPDVTSASLALFSVAQALGRVMTGSMSEAALNWKGNEWSGYEGIPRPFFLVVASALGIVAHAMLALSVHESMFVFGVTLSGFSFGMVWPMMVLIVGDLFGTAHVGANYLFFDGFTSAGGTLLLSKVVAQNVYERHAEHDSNDDSGNEVCYGQACFETTHLIISVLSATCVVSSMAMLRRTRHAYSRHNASTSRID
mmetsp:Transcript_29099/g.70266  ORF Transcript_29099/g.70266 Transcript_29099/m.70266 type:complete len:611 (+) Transcript_29099:205-2037(+)|eukprot:CAMPEP_0113632732 /NCGR_PEP_ID=MMETSP0017_2-20120614/17019_1 /TAXON_ID=2856 /ORGANISM="Cylindrotheca closterium" /LENGTH=610 /DNA_ID=CAMNT_0000543311 /DNA_START=130 /DNA_END=1962 /DNA_ORIENTATION=- /assembly_acc=CAM_ASM_000147